MKTSTEDIYLPHMPLQPPGTFLQPLCFLYSHQDGISLPTLQYLKIIMNSFLNIFFLLYSYLLGNCFS